MERHDIWEDLNVDLLNVVPTFHGMCRKLRWQRSRVSAVWAKGSYHLLMEDHTHSTKAIFQIIYKQHFIQLALCPIRESSPKNMKGEGVTTTHVV